ncbi:MBG domain-containing protein [Cesiribacter sp. SM1]|uniref:NHL domain-containing protein n=1 Tax=Cesiribacter sp. SM1 TaxID=2861196 RepID=UPI001CD67EF9|nr:MBG domain-containing protein [Cesiribacter sp. SM1]
MKHIYSKQFDEADAGNILAHAALVNASYQTKGISLVNVDSSLPTETISSGELAERLPKQHAHNLHKHSLLILLCLLLPLIQESWAQTITTIAGTGVMGYSGTGGDGGAAVNAQLYNPYGIATDASGNLYIADYYNHRIRKVDVAGKITTIAGTGEAGYSGDGGRGSDAMLNGPISLTLDGTGNLYIAEYRNHRIRKLSTDGTITTVAGKGVAGFSGDGGAAVDAQLNTPYSIAVDGSGNLYVSDEGNHRIRKVDTSGRITTIAGTGDIGFSGDGGAALEAEFYYPGGLALDATGNLYVADYGNHRIRKISTNGTITTIAGTGVAGFSGDGGAATKAQLNYADDLATDAAGNLYISDRSNYRIRKLNKAGIITTIAGTGVAGFSGDGGLATNATVGYTASVSVDAAGSIYVADFQNDRIRKIHTDGIITTVAGSSARGYSGDNGPAITAQMYNPGSLAKDVYGNMYVADFANHRIRKISPNGTITTIAGTGVAGFSGDGGAAIRAQLNYPVDVTIDGAGNIYIADRSNHRIRKINTAGTITTIAGTGVAGFGGDGVAAVQAHLNQPYGVAADAAGNIYIADRLNHRIRKVATNETITTIAGTGMAGFSGDGGAAVNAQLNHPYNIAIDASGNIYLADRLNNRIRKISTAGTITTVAGTGEKGYGGDSGAAVHARLNEPCGVTVNASGILYVADTYNNRIRKVAVSGRITTVAGTGEKGFGGDGGTATKALLNLPFGVEADASDNIFIADASNHRIRKVTGATALDYDQIAPGARVVPSITLDLDDDGMVMLRPEQVDNGSTDNVTGSNNLRITLSQSRFECYNSYVYERWQEVGEEGVPSGGYTHNLSLAISPEGTPYLAYLDEVNNYVPSIAKWNGSSWEPLGGSELSGYNHSIVFSPDGTLHYAAEWGVARWNGSSWQYLINNAGSGSITSLAFAPDGTPYIAQSDNNGSISVKSWNGSNWVAVGNMSPYAGNLGLRSLAVAPDGIPYLAFVDYNNGNRVSVLKWNGSSWAVISGAGASSHESSNAALAIASNGTLYLSFEDTNGNVTVVKWNSSSWNMLGDGVLEGGWGHSLAVSPDGTPHLASAALIQKWNGSGWQIVGGGSPLYSGQLYTQSLAIAPDGIPHIAVPGWSSDYRASVQKVYQSNRITVTVEDEAGNKATASTLVYIRDTKAPVVAVKDVVVRLNARGEATLTPEMLDIGTYDNCYYLGDGLRYSLEGKTSYTVADLGQQHTVTLWVEDMYGNINSGTAQVMVVEGVAPAARFMQAVEVVLDASGTATLSPDDVNDGSSDNYSSTANLKYSLSKTSFNCADLEVTNTWKRLGPAGVSQSYATNQGMSIAPDGTPYLYYNDLDGTTKLVKWNGSSWELLGGAGVPVGWTNIHHLALSPDGTPYIVYRDEQASMLKVLQWNGSNWEFFGGEGIPDEGSFGHGLTFSADGIMFVSFITWSVNGEVMMVQKWNGSSWQSLGQEGIPTGYVSSYIMKVAPDGTPYIIYSNPERNSVATVVKWSGSSWQTLGGENLSDGAAEGINLAISPAGVPYVAYTDEAYGTKLKVKRWNGSSWQSVGGENVSQGAAFTPNLAFSADGVIYVAYTDAASNYAVKLQQWDGSSWQTVGGENVSNDYADNAQLAISEDGVIYVAFSEAVKQYRTTVKAFAPTNRVTFTVEDEAGNKSIGFTYVYVVDELAPTAVSNRGMELDQLDSSLLTANILTYADQCSPDVSYSITKSPAYGRLELLSNAGAAITSFTQQQLIRGEVRYVSTSNVQGFDSFSFTASDMKGNASQPQSFSIRLKDVTSPVARTKNYTLGLQSSGMAVLKVADIENGSSDNTTAAGSLVFSLSRTNFGCTDLGANTVTLTVTDEAGNTSTALATVTVEDKIAPAISVKKVTLLLNANGTATLTEADAVESVTDQCGAVNVSLSKTSFGCADVGDTTVKLLATDASGNVTTQDVSVTIADQLAPIAVAKNIVLVLGPAEFTTLTAAQLNGGSADNCTPAASLLYSLDKTSFSCADVGANVVTLRVTDAAGNSSTATGTVTVEEKVAPVAIAKNITLALDVFGLAMLTPEAVNNGSADNCRIASMRLDKTSFSCQNIGANPVTLTVTDASGNSSTATATVNVVNVLTPVASGNWTSSIAYNSIASFAINEIPAASGYIWTVPGGFEIVSGQNTPQISLKATSGSASGNITVKAISACGEGPAVSVSIVATKATPQLSFHNENRTYSTENFTLNASSSTVGSITYQVAEELTAAYPGDVTLSGTGNSVVSVLKSGKVRLRASVAADEYYAAASAEMELTINKAAATVTISGLNQEFNGEQRPVSVSTNPAGLDISVSYNGVVTVPAAVGEYAVRAVIVDDNYTGETSAMLIISAVTGISDPEAHNILLYPNPTTNSTMLELERGASAQITVMDLTGRIIRQAMAADSYQVNLEEQPAGLYFIRIQQQGKAAVTLKLQKL